jgi:glucose dehydrogenase
MLCFTINRMRIRTYLSLTLSVLLMISIGFIGSTNAQPTLKDPNLESKIIVKELSFSNNTAFVDNNKNNWPIVNHDLYGSRSSSQTTIEKDNVDKLEVKWRLLNEYEIQDPPIIIENKGYVQDYAGNVIAFDTRTGHIFWKVNAGGGPTMGLAFDSGTILQVQHPMPLF